MTQRNTEKSERIAKLEQEVSDLLDNLSLCKGNELAAQVEDLMAQVEDLTAQLTTARQKAWEAAVTLVEEYMSTGGTTSPGQATIRKIAVRCREQAKNAPRI